MGNWIEAQLAFDMIEKLKKGNIQMTREEIHRILFDPNYTQSAPILGQSPMDNWVTCERDGGYPFLVQLPYIFHTEGMYTCQYNGMSHRAYYKVGDVLKSEHFIWNPLPPEAPKINLISGDGWSEYDDTTKSAEIFYGKSFVLNKTGCDHAWKSYIGLFEAYDFCEKCDKKRETK